MKRYNTNHHEDVPAQKQKFDECIVGEDQQIDEQNPSKEREYVQQLLKEISELDQLQHSNAKRLLELEISKVQSSGRIPAKEYKYVDVYKEKPIRLSTKVLVPVQDHPKFNFVGKLLGPKGNSLKRLQEETMCKMSILGRGSMRDPVKEKELKSSGDPKYTHLAEELHVEVLAFGPPAEAYARMAFALAEIRKYLIPDNNDFIRQEQLRELESLNSSQTLKMERHPRGPSVTRAPFNIPRAMPNPYNYSHKESEYSSPNPHRRNALMNYSDASNQHRRSHETTHHPEALRYRSNIYQKLGKY